MEWECSYLCTLSRIKVLLLDTSKIRMYFWGNLIRYITKKLQLENQNNHQSILFLFYIYLN